ncbi:hypothetical protein KAJ27_11510 [bacterium]|nr:hypothetical protein [bacterium]
MSIPEDVIKSIEAEFEEEIKRIKGPSDGPVKALADIESTVLDIRNRFGQRLMEEAIKYQGTGEIIGEKKMSTVPQSSKKQRSGKKGNKHPIG